MQTNKETIERLFRQHYPRMYQLVRVLLKDDAASKDVVSDLKAKEAGDNASAAVDVDAEWEKFDKMMAEIATYYDMQVTFDNAEAKSLRLYYEWDSHSGIESIVKELNQFENVNIEVEGHTLVVK